MSRKHLAFGALVAALVVGGLVYGALRSRDAGTPTATQAPPAPESDVADAADLTTPQALAWISYTAEELASITNPHEHDGHPVCQACHVDARGALLNEIDALCAACHTWEHPGHPVKVVQPEPIPAGVKLGDGNRVQCTTCHEAHDVHTQQAGLRRDYSRLCQACHPGY